VHQSAPYVRWGVCCAAAKDRRVFVGDGVVLFS